jgi:hypothetical protein
MLCLFTLTSKGCAHLPDIFVIGLDYGTGYVTNAYTHVTALVAELIHSYLKRMCSSSGNLHDWFRLWYSNVPSAYPCYSIRCCAHSLLPQKDVLIFGASS